jgi:hypothetical protein
LEASQHNSDDDSSSTTQQQQVTTRTATGHGNQQLLIVKFANPSYLLAHVAAAAWWALAGPALQTAFEVAGCHIIVKEAMANGRLTPRNDQPDFQRKLTVLQDAAWQVRCSCLVVSVPPACFAKQAIKFESN